VGAEATLSACRLFSGTQMLHHLAHTSGAEAAHAAVHELVACSLELCRQDAAVHYVAAHLTQAAGPFYALAAAFSQGHAPGAPQALLPVHYYEFSTLCVADAPVATQGGMRVTQASSGDLRRIGERAAALWGRTYAQALDLTEETLVAPPAAVWQQADLPRERAVALARTASGQAIAACVLDRAAPGSDLFHGFDVLTWVPLAEPVRSVQLQQAHALLVAYAKNWFLLRGAGHFTYAQVQTQLAGGDVGCAPGAVKRGSGAVWVVGRPLFAELMALGRATPQPPRTSARC
jgi:hypothetical protein